MSLALEQARSLFTGWFRSCRACLAPEEDGPKGRAVENGGVQREMQVCHTQPHLVPPMKLVVHDDLPSPSPPHQHRRSLSSWISEGKMRPSRASVRASISLKRQSTAPLKIGAPTDFRRVQSFPNPVRLPTEYQPLELSIHRSGNRLSDLPSFDSFQLHEDCQRRTLAVPPRALPSSSVQARRCLFSDPAEVVPRKLVGSGGGRSSGHLQHWTEQPQPVRIASALVPHFSIGPVETSLPEPEPMPVPVHARPEKIKPTPSIEIPGLVSNAQGHVEEDPYTPLPVMNQEGRAQNEPLKDPASSNDSPSSASSRTMPSRISSLHRPSTAENRKTIASVPLPNRMTQWFFAKGPRSPRQVSLAGEKGFAWERTRTLSGTTVASDVTTT